jgi:hypothetical protein
MAAVRFRTTLSRIRTLTFAAAVEVRRRTGPLVTTDRNSGQVLGDQNSGSRGRSNSVTSCVFIGDF